MEIQDESSVSSLENKRLADVVRTIGAVLSTAVEPAHVIIAEVCRFEDKKDRVYYEITIEHDTKVTLSMAEIAAMDTELITPAYKI